MAEKILDLNREKYIFWILIGILILSAGFYMFLINTTVRNVVARENLEEESGKIAVDINTKEFQYISMRNSVTLELAYSKGFKDVSDKTFISTKTANLVSLGQVLGVRD